MVMVGISEHEFECEQNQMTLALLIKNGLCIVDSGITKHYRVVLAGRTYWCATIGKVNRLAESTTPAILKFTDGKPIR